MPHHTHLPPQHVEVVGGRRAVDDLPVGLLQLRAQVPAGKPLGLVDLGQHVGVFVAHLQEALEARAAMLGPLAVVAVRQQHGEARLAQPLGLP